MKMMKMVMSAAVVSASVVGCGGQSAGGTELQTKEQQAELINGGFYGSDTLKGAMVASIVGAGIPDLTYRGTGTGVGETCLRGGGSAVCPNPKMQSIAPMSRDLRAPCQTGERSNVIALDAVNLFVKSNNTLANITTADIKKLFGGDANGVQGTSYPTGCTITTWGQLNGNPSDTRPITIYRRDDLSGTTDVFKSLVGLQTAVTDKYAFCANVLEVKDSPTNYSPTCSASDSATTCIGKLTAASDTAIGYAGDSGIYPPAPATAQNKKLTVNGIASNETNIRKLVNGGSGVYPLARKLFLNENLTSTRASQEEELLAYIYDTDTAAFEQILKNQGFIACGTTPLACGGANNDGRGAGLCNYQP